MREESRGGGEEGERAAVLGPAGKQWPKFRQDVLQLCLEKQKQVINYGTMCHCVVMGLK